jgi:RimJ/RimL family protein N-acetyltransferase
MERLETDRLILRMFEPDDLNAYAEMCADPEVMQYLGGIPLTRDEAWRNMAMVLGHWRLRGFGLWAVEERATKTLVGRVGCWQPEGWPGLELAWTLRRAFWGQGFATEAARAALAFAFDVLERTHVISLIHPDNEPSIRVARRIGARQEGRSEVFGHSVLCYGVRRKRPRSV